jgi:hypothetical protein
MQSTKVDNDLKVDPDSDTDPDPEIVGINSVLIAARLGRLPIFAQLKSPVHLG